jgi:NADP-dependent 3-hydroxy acid dehydrogenase YdfG
MLGFKLALITGASSGLGNALGHALSKRGIPLILVARHEEKLKKTALLTFPLSRKSFVPILANPRIARN